VVDVDIRHTSANRVVQMEIFLACYSSLQTPIASFSIQHSTFCLFVVGDPVGPPCRWAWPRVVRGVGTPEVISSTGNTWALCANAAFKGPLVSGALSLPPKTLFVCLYGLTWHYTTCHTHFPHMHSPPPLKLLIPHATVYSTKLCSCYPSYVMLSKLNNIFFC